MAFWGAVVKSGKPFTLAANEATGINRLHLSRATLGYGDASPKSTLQCNVAPYCPILLCILTPNKVESCELNLEFEEAHEVTFSVIGPRSIHLSGYFPRSPDFRQSSDESEPYGEDINYTDMERSSGDDYDYSDSFINDDVLSGCGSHVLSSDHDEISTKELAAKTTDKERKEGRGGRLRKKFRTSDETSVRANDDSINDDSIQAFNIDNDYKISKVLSSEIPLTLENGKPSAKCENKTLEATVHTNKTVETGEPSENCEKKKIFEATTYTHWSLDPREDDVELSPILKGCEILVKSLVVNNSEDGEGPESLQNEKEIKSSSDDVLPSPNATLTKTKRKMDMGDETLYECSERKKQAIDKNMEKEDGGAKEPLETEISSNKVMIEHTEKGKLEETSAVKSDG